MNTSANSLENGPGSAYRDNAEPAVDELMNDPIIHKLMESDHVSPDMLAQLHAHIEALRERYAATEQLQ